MTFLEFLRMTGMRITSPGSSSWPPLTAPQTAPLSQGRSLQVIREMRVLTLPPGY